jgi:hypothetical protein
MKTRECALCELCSKCLCMYSFFPLSFPTIVCVVFVVCIWAIVITFLVHFDGVMGSKIIPSSTLVIWSRARWHMYTSSYRFRTVYRERDITERQGFYTSQDQETRRTMEQQSEYISETEKKITKRVVKRQRLTLKINLG